MTAEKRRAAILHELNNATQPISATALAKLCGVSRQVVVGDVALLRAGGTDIAATPRGYALMQEDRGITCRMACCHRGSDMETELNIMVDQGCTVLDVVVEHPVYGQLTGALQLKSRYDVQQFIRRSAKARPLSLLTEDTCARVKEALRTAGFLLED